jgi:RNA polymerase sigma factor (sigma-70 family)
MGLPNRLQEVLPLPHDPFFREELENREALPQDDGGDDLGTHPFLENEQLYEEYLRACRTGDEKKAGQIQWHIALANQKLLWWFARKQLNKWNPPCLTLQDLVHYGLFGILKAVEKFDPGFATKLSSYAGWWIMRYIESAIFENGSMIRVPEYRINQKAQIDAAALDLLERGVEPSLAHIAAELNARERKRAGGNPERKKSPWTPESVDEVNQATIHFMSCVDRSMHEGGAPDYACGDDQGNTPESLSMAPFMRSGFRKILEISGLSSRDRMILDLYFYGEARSRAEVSRLFGVTREAFSAIMENFEEAFPDIFKKASERSSNMMSVLRFCRQPAANIEIIEAGCAPGAPDAAEIARQLAVPEKKVTAVLHHFQKFFPDLHASYREPGYLHSVLRFSRIARDHQTMLGVYFCGDDLTKQDLGILCGVSRERVRQIIGSFAETYKGPLRRLFLREFFSAREVCEQMLAQKKERYAAEVEQFLSRHATGESAVMLKLYYLQRLGTREIASRLPGGISAGTVTHRLKQAAATLPPPPVHIAPFFCEGHTSLSPKEMFARQIWGFLPGPAQADFMESLDEDERIIFSLRLVLGGARAKLKELVSRTGKHSTSDISGALEKILLSFIEYAGEYFEQNPQR